MSRVDIKNMAAAAEIVASLAVVVSLVFVIFSINQNTAALRSLNDNFLYQISDERLSDLATNGELASIVAKATSGDELSEAEEIRYSTHQSRLLNLWELAFNRHAEGLMPPKQWDAWNISISANVSYYLTEQEWKEMRYSYGKDFSIHVDSAFSHQ